MSILLNEYKDSYNNTETRHQIESLIKEFEQRTIVNEEKEKKLNNFEKLIETKFKSHPNKILNE